MAFPSTQTLSGHEFRVSLTLPIERANGQPLHVGEHRPRTPDVCSSEDGVSQASSPCGTPRWDRVGRVDSLSDYLGRSWGEPTPDCSPLHHRKEDSNERLKSAANSSRETCSQKGPTFVKAKLGFQFRDRLALRLNRLPYRFESHETVAPDDYEGEDGVAFDPCGEDPGLVGSDWSPLLRSNDCEISSQMWQISELPASSNRDAQAQRSRGEVKSELNSIVLQHFMENDILQHSSGAATPSITTAEISKLIGPFLDEMITTVEDVVRQRSGSPLPDPTSTRTRSTSFEGHIVPVDPQGVVSLGAQVGEDMLDSNISENSRKVNVCYHWRSKGFCWYRDECKFMHTKEKRGVGKQKKARG